MSDFLPRPAPDDPHQPDEISAPIVPAPPENITQPTPTQVPATEISTGETPNAKVSANESSANESSATQVEPNAMGDALDVPIDPVAQAADREGFKFLAIGFALFFAVIAICASVVALAMKSMGI